jgi:hypothetical protein
VRVDPAYRHLGALAEGNAGVLCGPIGGGPCMELPQQTATNAVGEGLLGDVSPVIREGG